MIVYFILTPYIEDIKNLFDKIIKAPKMIEQKRKQSDKMTQNILDYKKLAVRLYQ